MGLAKLAVPPWLYHAETLPLACPGHTSLLPPGTGAMFHPYRYSTSPVHEPYFNI